MALRARIPLVPGAYPLDPFHDQRIPPGRSPKVGPMPPSPPSDDVVDRGQGQAAVGEVAVTHGVRLRVFGMRTPVPL